MTITPMFLSHPVMPPRIETGSRTVSPVMSCTYVVLRRYLTSSGDPLSPLIRGFRLAKLLACRLVHPDEAVRYRPAAVRPSRPSRRRSSSRRDVLGGSGIGRGSCTIVQRPAFGGVRDTTFAPTLGRRPQEEPRRRSCPRSMTRSLSPTQIRIRPPATRATRWSYAARGSDLGASTNGSLRDRVRSDACVGGVQRLGVRAMERRARGCDRPRHGLGDSALPRLHPRPGHRVHDLHAPDHALPGTPARASEGRLARRRVAAGDDRGGGVERERGDRPHARTHRRTLVPRSSRGRRRRQQLDRRHRAARRRGG